MVPCDSRWHVKAVVGNTAPVKQAVNVMCKVVRVSSECRSSHPDICRRVNSLLFTFVTKDNVSDLGKVMEPTGIPGQLPRCGDAPIRAGSIHSTGHRTWTGPRVFGMYQTIQ